MLVKLTIVPFDKPETVQAGGPSGPPFVAQFNPETFGVDNEFVYADKKPADGADGGAAKFQYIKPRTFTFELLLDETGAGGPALPVLEQLLNFQTTVGFRGTIHRPQFLVINWGSFLVTCVLENYKIEYKLFRSIGTPLRALLTATFREHKSDFLRKLIENKSSPDVPHGHDVIGGEHLSMLTTRYYGEPQHAVKVAEANQLDTIRNIDVGRRLVFPRIESLPSDDGEEAAL